MGAKFCITTFLPYHTYKNSNIFIPIIIYSAAAGGGGGGAMAAAMVSHFRYMSMFNTVLVSSIQSALLGNKIMHILGVGQIFLSLK